MKILTAILTCTSTQARADACLATWIRDIKSPHDYVFYGDKAQSQAMDKTWNCSPDSGEHRRKLPQKTFKMLVESLNHDWDFLFKCDDDTYACFDRLIEFLKTYDPSKDLYIGKQLGNKGYAQGGAGYILSRSAVQKCVNASEVFLTSPISEDRTLGRALKSQDVNLTPTLSLSTPSPKARKDQSPCLNAIFKDEKITTHYVQPETMRTIYNDNKSKQ